MGADGGIHYISYTPKTLKTKLLEMLEDWLCSDECSYMFDGYIEVRDDKIMISPEEDTPDELATPLFTDEQLDFIANLRDAIVDYFTSNQYIPDSHSDNIMTWKQFELNQTYDKDFDFRDDFNELLDLTKEINEVWDAGYLWLYWDTNSYHHPNPFGGLDARTEMKELYDSFKTNDTFKKIFTNFDQFAWFVNDLPGTDYIQTWT